MEVVLIVIGGWIVAILLGMVVQMLREALFPTRIERANATWHAELRKAAKGKR